MSLILLENKVLLNELKTQVLVEKAATSKVLEYLNEVDRRRLWVEEGYASLFDFCVRFLNYSEGEASRRIQAARLTERIAEVKPLLESGELSLTSLTLLSPVLTKENAATLLPKVAHQPMREVEKILAHTFPERKVKESVEIELDNELKELFEKAKQKANEIKLPEVLRKALRAFVKEPKVRAKAKPILNHEISEPLRAGVTSTVSVSTPSAAGQRTQPRHGLPPPPTRPQSKQFVSYKTPQPFQMHPRRVPASTAAKVKRLASFMCEYRSPARVRCNQTAHLEIDHVKPFAYGGSSKDLNNLRCLCKVHNLYFARKYFKKSTAILPA